VDHQRQLPPSKKLAFAALSLVVGCVFALALAEAALRLLGIGYGNAPLETHPILHHVHPRNYSFLSYKPNDAYDGVHVYYSTDRRVVSSSEWHIHDLAREPLINAVARL
jgi:hypothetical protein